MFHIWLKVLSSYSRCRPTITSTGFFFSLSCLRRSLRSPLQQKRGPSEPVYYASFRLFKTSLVRVNIISGRGSRFRKGIQAMFSVIILWDNYFIITPLYLSSVIDIGVVCFHCIPHPPLPWESHLWLDVRESQGGIVGDLGGQISGQKNSSFPLETMGAIYGTDSPEINLNINVVLLKLVTNVLI